MIDLLRVYGTLCWNLSQITGRKDIPMIHLTYSPHDASLSTKRRDSSYLQYLENQREELKKAVLQAPCYRLDNLASFIETHGERLAHFLEALISYRKRARKARLKTFAVGLGLSLICGAAAFILSLLSPPLAGTDMLIKSAISGGAALLFLTFWSTAPRRFFFKRFHKRILQNMNNLTALNSQTRQDSWESIRDLVLSHLKSNNGKFSLTEVRQKYTDVWKVYIKGSKEIREALRELEDLLPDEEEEFFKARLGLTAAEMQQYKTEPDIVT
jgi:EH domain-containing protein 1